MALNDCNTANGATGIGRPRSFLGLLIGAPDISKRPNDSNRMATAVAWSLAIPNLAMNFGIAFSIRALAATPDMYIF